MIVEILGTLRLFAFMVSSIPVTAGALLSFAEEVIRSNYTSFRW